MRKLFRIPNKAKQLFFRRLNKKFEPLSFDKFEKVDIPLDKRKIAIKQKVASESKKIVEMTKKLILNDDLIQGDSGIVGKDLKFCEELGAVMPKNDYHTITGLDKGQNPIKKLSFSQLKDLIMKTPIPPSKLLIKGKEIRLSKYLSRASIASRKQSEKMIDSGCVRVNNRVVSQNVLVDPLKDEIQIFTNDKWSFSTHENSRLWVFYKPRGLLCDRRGNIKRIPGDDRMDIYQYLDGILGIDHFISVVSDVELIW